MIHSIFTVSGYKECIRYFALDSEAQTNKIKISNKADQEALVKFSNKFDTKPIR